MFKKSAIKPDIEMYISLLIGIIFLITVTAHAGPKVTSFRCGGNREIKIGITKYTAIELCGEPDAREVKAKQESAKNEVEEWYYSCTADKKSYLLLSSWNVLQKRDA